MTEEQLSALLRLKRHEQPPPGYFDRLLQDVHRRQREELLQQPLWKIALERWQTFFSAHSMGTLSYAGAVASVLILGATAATLLTSIPAGSSSFAQNEGLSALPTPEVASAPQPALQRSLATSLPPPQFQGNSQPSRDGIPRYVIDARPVSYDQSFSF